MRTWKSFFLLVLCGLLLTGMLIGCGSTGDHTETDSETQPVSQIHFVENGVTEYTVIRSDRAANKSAAALGAAKIRSAITKVSGASIKIETDWDNTKNDPESYEILVGTTTREASSKAIEGLTENEYCIAVDGHKIVIVGGSDSALTLAVDQFLLLYCGYITDSNYTAASTLSIPEDLHMKQAYDNSATVILWLSGGDVPYAEELKSVLTTKYANFQCMTKNDALTDVFSKDHPLVIIGGCDKVPNGTISAVQKYLNNGGHILTLGGPAFTTELYKNGSEWLAKPQYMMSLIEDLDSNEKQLIFDTDKESVIKSFGRSSNTMGRQVTMTVDDYGLDGTDKQLCVDVENLDSWEIIQYNFKATIDAPNLIGFNAKGDSDTDTTSLYIEIYEKDSTRWYATVSLTDEWTYCTLSPSNFKWWAGDPNKSNSKPDFSQLSVICFGFAQSGLSTSIGHHVYYLSDPTLIRLDDVVTAEAPLVVDTLSPEYEMFPVTNAAKLSTHQNQIFVTNRDYVVPTSSISCSPGRQGTGYNMERASRFIPLIETLDSKGLHAGYLAWFQLFSSTTKLNGDMEGAMIGCVSATSKDFYDANGLAAITEMIDAMVRPAMLVEAGATEHIYVLEDTQEIQVGASYVHTALNGGNYEMTQTLYCGDTVLAEYKTDTAKAQKIANDLRTMTNKYALSDKLPDKIVTTLSVNGTVFDKITQQISFWSPKPLNERSYISKEDGYFKKDGKIINFYGVNYMPSSGVAESNSNLFEQYVSRGAYDPEVIHNDLLRIKDIGMNAVSVFVYVQTIQNTNNMLDLVSQCEELGIYVDMSIRPDAYPVSGFNADDVHTLITKLHFQENDNIIAYDIAWEPRLGTYASGGVRSKWDKDWAQWIVDQFGTVEHAEELFKVKIPRDKSGNLIAPTDAMLDNTSETYRGINNAYYRFIDDTIGKIFNNKLQSMRADDPYHLISFRMSMAGSAAMGASEYCYDFQSLVAAVDIIEPEGYALSSAEDRILQIPFANAYARYTNPESPVVWKEFGRHVWSGSNFNSNRGSLEASAEYYASVLKYAYESYTSGMYCWYFPGGFRINENSDYGIINPDGSDRPATKYLREYASKFINQGERPTTVQTITVERDSYGNNLVGMYGETMSKLASALKAGKLPVFINKQQTAADDKLYADAVLDMATGDVSATGLFPLKYVNGCIRSYAFSNDGKTMTLTVTNTQAATWKSGTVSVVTVGDSELKFNQVINEEVAPGQTVTVKISVSKVGKAKIRFSVNNVLFGPVYDTTSSSAVARTPNDIFAEAVTGPSLEVGKDLVAPVIFDSIDVSKYTKLTLTFKVNKRCNLASVINGEGQFELSSDASIGDYREAHWNSVELMKAAQLADNNTFTIELVLSEGSNQGNSDAGENGVCDYKNLTYFRWYNVNQRSSSDGIVITLVDTKFS